MHQSWWRCLWVGMYAVVLVAPGAWAADIVSRKSEKNRVAGTVTASTKTELVIKPPTGEPLKIPANDVISVEWDDGNPVLRLAIADDNGGRFDRAIEGYQRFLSEYRGSNDLFKKDVSYLRTMCLARAAIADPDQQAEATKAIESLLGGSGDHFRYFEALVVYGRLLIAKNDFDGARKAFGRMSEGPWPDLQLRSQIELARVNLAEGRLAEAEQTFDQVIAAAKGDSRAERTCRYSATLGKVRSLIAQQRYDDSIAVTREVIEQTSAEETSVLADAWLLQGEAYSRQNRKKEAAFAYLRIDLLFSRETAQHAEALYHLSRLWDAVDQPERSLEARGKLQSKYQNSPWTKRLATGG